MDGIEALRKTETASPKAVLRLPDWLCASVGVTRLIVTRSTAHPNLAQSICATRINTRPLIRVRSCAAPTPYLSAAACPDCAPRRAPE
jgi:hypothetical protein